MTLMGEILKDAAMGVHVAQEPENLAGFAEPGCAAAIWHRDTCPDFQAWIDALNPDELPNARLVLRCQNVRAALADVCNNAGLENGPHRQHLINDITALVRMFSDLMGAPFVRMRLDRISTNACRKFHVDAITARLVCTYRGTGTQYGIASNGNDPTRVFTLPTGDPILLRGTLWQEHPSAGLLHRSPPIEGTGETRLVLVVDPVFDVKDV